MFRTLLLRAWNIYWRFAMLNMAYKVVKMFYIIGKARFILWKHLPGQPSDLLAHELRKRATELHDFFAEAGYNCPNAPLVQLPMPNLNLLCNTPESIQWALKLHVEDITRGGNEDFTLALGREFLGGEGIFMLAYGENWKQQRKTASLIFTKSNFNSLFFETYIEKSQILVDVISQSADGRTVFDLQNIFSLFAMDSVEKIFFGKQNNSILNGQSEFAKQFDATHDTYIKSLVTTVVFQILNRAILPYPFGTLTHFGDTTRTLYSFFVRRTNRWFKQFTQNKEQLHQIIDDNIEEAKKDANLETRSDLMANFLKLGVDTGLRNDTLRDIALNFTLAGKDTTAATLGWLFFELTQNINFQEELIYEIQSKLKGKEPTIDDLSPNSLPLLAGVVYETLRLHPAVPTIEKAAIKEIKYLDGTIIPRGAKIIVSPYSFGRNPHRYPDPLKFDPKRWIPFSQPDPFSFPVFQGGPRICLGRDMALLEIKVLTVRLLQKFRFELKEGEREKIKYSLMLAAGISNGTKEDGSESRELLCRCTKI